PPLARSAPSTSPGQLYGFGENYYGELGTTKNNNDSKAANPTPEPVALPGATSPVVQAAAGSSYSLAVTAAGQLYAFGENFFGQLGDAKNVKTVEPNPTPTPVELPGATGSVTQVATGEHHSLVVTATGQLYAFGENFYGQLGTAENDKSGVPNAPQKPVALPGAPGPVTQIAAGSFHSLAVTATGQLYAFGENFYGELGNPEHNGVAGEANPTPTLVKLPGATGPVTKVAAGTF